jgi:uncharacterized membrane protein
MTDVMVTAVAARDDPGVRWIYLASVWIHLVAAMAWVGGMLLFVLAVRPAASRLAADTRTALLSDVGRRLAELTWYALPVLAITGTFNLWARGVRPSDLIRPEWLQTTFGHLVAVKIGLVALVLALAVAHARLHDRQHARLLGRLTLVVALAIVALAVGIVRSL